jgi:hypothetical protein
MGRTSLLTPELYVYRHNFSEEIMTIYKEILGKHYDVKDNGL